MINYILNPWVSGIIMLLILGYVQGKKYYGGVTCKIKKDMSEKVVIITGANRGVGKETARELAKLGARIIFACRSEDRTRPIIQAIKKETENERLEFMPLDLSDINSIKRFVMMFKPRYQRLDILINNAGAYKSEYLRTREGFELNFCINTLGPFLLTNLLLDLLIQTPYSRIINLSGNVHASVAPESFHMNDLNEHSTFQSGHNGQYAKAKLATIMFSKELQRRIQDQGVKVVCANPGNVETDLYADFMNGSPFSLFYKCFFPIFSFFLKDENQGAQTSIYCAIEQYDKLVSGGYYEDCQISEISAIADNVKAQQIMWDNCINWVDLT